MQLAQQQAEIITSSVQGYAIDDPTLYTAYEKYQKAVVDSGVESSGVLRWVARESSQLEPDERFILLWATATHFWRIRSYDLFQRAVTEIEDLLPHLGERDRDIARSYLYVLQVQERESREGLPSSNTINLAREAVEQARRVGRKYELEDDRNGALPGALNVFAGAVAARVEGLGLSSEEVGSSNGQQMAIAVEDAIKDIRVAEKLRNYPKYFATEARLLAALGHYREAETAVVKAMELEDGLGRDFNIRMVEYTAIKERIGVKRHLKSVVEEIDKIRDGAQSLNEATSARMDEMEQSQKKLEERTIGFTGLLLAIVSLVLSGGVLASENQAEPENGVLILGAVGVVSGLLLVMFNLYTARERAWLSGLLGIILLLAMAGVTAAAYLLIG